MFKNRILKLAIANLMVSACYVAPAGAASTSPIAWKYQTSYNSTTGLPSSMVNQTTFSALATKVINLLPEGVNNSKKGLLTNDQGGNVFLTADSNVKLVFIYEGAGYQNSIGYFTFPSSGLTGVINKSASVTPKIVFPNFSATTSGGYLHNGDTVDLGTIKAGQAIGITLAANGWGGGNGQVNTNESTNNIFYTISELNPETPGTSNLQSHTILLSDPTSKTLVVGIEDLNRQSSSLNPNGYSPDNDFNDAVVGIQITPLQAGVSYENAVDLSHVYTINGSANSTTAVPPAVVTTPTTAVAIPATGESGQLSWREISIPPVVVDPIKAAKAAAIAAKKTAAVTKP